MPPQPYQIQGTITLNGSAQQGVYVFVWNSTRDPPEQAWINNVSSTRTNSSGNYLLELANVSPNYANSDVVYIYVWYEDIHSWATATVDTTQQSTIQNFTLTRASRLTEGVLNSSNTASVTDGLRKGLNTALNDGLA